MENIMKEILVSGVQARVENGTFIKRVAFLLNDDLLSILCTGIPVKILGYNENEIKEYIKKQTSREEIVIDSVGVSDDPLETVKVCYHASTTRYLRTVEEAEKVIKRQDRYAGNGDKSEAFSIAAKVAFSATINLPMIKAKEFCTLKML